MIVICGNEKFDISERPDILDMDFFKALKEEKINEIELIMYIPLFKMFIENKFELESFDNEELENIFIGYLYFGVKDIHDIVKIIAERLWKNEREKNLCNRVDIIENYLTTTYLEESDIINMFNNYDIINKNNILESKCSKFDYLDCLIKEYVKKEKLTLIERIAKHKEFLNDMCPSI